MVINHHILTDNYDKGKKMPDKNKVAQDKGGTVHIDAETMKKIEEYQAFIKKNHPEMPVPTKGQIVRSSVNYWHHQTLGARI